MTDLSNGFMISIIGMGGTLLSLCILILVIELLKRAFPYREEEEDKGKEAA